MHRKTVLFAQEGMQSYGRYAHVVGELDADFAVCRADELAGRLAQADLVICTVDATLAGNLTELERAFHNAEGTALFLVVERAALARLRLPAHIPADFMLESGEDAELAIRLRRLLWPAEETANSDFITVDDMAINLSTYQVLVDGEPVDFTYLEYALLAFLVTHPGHAYSRDALLSRVWGFDYYGGSRTVDVHVRRVRAKLGSELSEHLRTVRGVGYMWE